ncbi:hypothetical protein [Pseudomonas phage PSA11]|nr:hypothetical protein [Pseudomonas phage PSA11]
MFKNIAPIEAADVQAYKEKRYRLDAPVFFVSTVKPLSL